MSEQDTRTSNELVLSPNDIRWISKSPHALQLLIDGHHVNEAEADAIGEPELLPMIRASEERRKVLEAARDVLQTARGIAPGDMQIVDLREYPRPRRCGWFGEGRGQCLLQESHRGHHTCEEDGRLLAEKRGASNEPFSNPGGTEPPEPTADMIHQGIWAWQRNERASTAEDVRAIYIAMRRMEMRTAQPPGEITPSDRSRAFIVQEPGMVPRVGMPMGDFNASLDEWMKANPKATIYIVSVPGPLRAAELWVELASEYVEIRNDIRASETKEPVR